MLATTTILILNLIEISYVATNRGYRLQFQNMWLQLGIIRFLLLAAATADTEVSNTASAVTATIVAGCVIHGCQTLAVW